MAATKAKPNVTNDPARKSWVDGANSPDCPFPIQNLPYGVALDRGKSRIVCAIGDQALSLSVLEEAGLLRVPDGPVFQGGSLNPFMSLGSKVWSDLRRRLSDLLSDPDGELKSDPALCLHALMPLSQVQMVMPFEVSGYTDFYASEHHAANVGTMFRGREKALMPNWKHIPIGYNGRASTVVVSGTPVRRPLGQVMPAGGDGPVFCPTEKLDIELELGAVVGSHSAMGARVTPDEAAEMIFGYVLLNDWSARDIQVWEYQPLGPFQSKAFASTISPWVVTTEALEPFGVQGPPQDPTPLPYLQQTEPRGLNIDLSATLNAAGEREPLTFCRTNANMLYWSSAQQLAHHTSSGCAMRTGDLLGSGTISGPEPGSFGSLLETTWNGEEPLALKSGASRVFLEDGDSITLSGSCKGDGYQLGFGDAEGMILPAVER